MFLKLFKLIKPAFYCLLKAQEFTLKEKPSFTKYTRGPLCHLVLCTDLSPRDSGLPHRGRQPPD